jgi:hypothetical protein
MEEECPADDFVPKNERNNITARPLGFADDENTEDAWNHCMAFLALGRRVENRRSAGLDLSTADWG